MSSAGHTPDDQATPRSIRARLLSLLVHPTAPPLGLGIVLAAALIAVETLVVSLLKAVAPENAFGAVFLLGVLVISAGWGFGLAVTTTFVSAAVYVYFHLGTDGGFLPRSPADLMAIVIFLPIALLANVLVGQARVRAAESAQRHREASRLAQQQTALRRVATLVARGASPSDVFAAVADELATTSRMGSAGLFRFEPDNAGILVAAHNAEDMKGWPVGERFLLDGENVAAMVMATGRSARMNSHERAAGPTAARGRELGIHSGVAAPIVVNGRMWGAAIVASSRPEPPPPDTESRIEDFVDLVVTAISNAETRAELTASRARIVAAGDDARRRLERDLHDGAQQRLVSLGLELRAVEASLPSGLDGVSEQVSRVVDGLVGVSKELQEISRGIHPAILAKGGLGAALKTLARRSAVPVDLTVYIGRRLPQSAEVAAYYVVAEALANAAKHSQASSVDVDICADETRVRLSVRDDGIGGADPRKGTGLIGLVDRVSALSGQMEITSPAGGGTALQATIPFEAT